MDVEGWSGSLVAFSTGLAVAPRGTVAERDPAAVRMLCKRFETSSALPLYKLADEHYRDFMKKWDLGQAAAQRTFMSSVIVLSQILLRKEIEAARSTPVRFLKTGCGKHEGPAPAKGAPAPCDELADCSCGAFPAPPGRSATTSATWFTSEPPRRRAPGLAVPSFRREGLDRAQRVPARAAPFRDGVSATWCNGATTTLLPAPFTAPSRSLPTTVRDLARPGGEHLVREAPSASESTTPGFGAGRRGARRW